jgi:sugar (pentulose or hexulose) kinase
MGSLIGRVSAGAAGRFGLSPGIPLIAGGPDFITALIGVGVLEPGMVCDRAGSSEGINLCAAAPVSAPGLRVLPHAAEGFWNIGALIPSSGSLFEWFRTLSGQETRPYGDLLREITALPPGGGWLFPEEASPEKFPGLFFSPRGLGDRPRFGRAVLEAMGFRVREALELLGRRGFPVAEMRLSGGQGKNPRWNQLKADITGRTLLAPEIPDGELAGDAMLGMTALGEAGSVREAAGRMLRIKARYEPEPGAFRVYTELWQKYRELREKFRGILG